MYGGTLYSGDIINAFKQAVPGCFVIDNHEKDGWINIGRGLKDIRWQDQLTGGKVYRQVPAETLMCIPQGNVTPASRYVGLRLVRPGWRVEFREKAMPKLTPNQLEEITEILDVGEVFPGVH